MKMVIVVIKTPHEGRGGIRVKCLPFTEHVSPTGGRGRGHEGERLNNKLSHHTAEQMLLKKVSWSDFSC